MSRPPLQGIGNYAPPRRPPNQQSHPIASSKPYPFVSFARQPVSATRHFYQRQSLPSTQNHHVKGMVPDIAQNISTIDRPKKKRLSSNEPRSFDNVHHKRAKRSKVTSTSKTQNFKVVPLTTSSEIPTKEWLILPQSQYGIKYDLSTSTTREGVQEMSGISILEMAANKSPFELKMQQLRYVLQSRYPQGASLASVREIFEPGDVDYAFSSSLPGPPTVDVTKLARHQVDRLRLMVIPPSRQTVLVSYLSTFEMLPFNGSRKVADHFETFKVKYSKIRDSRVKFSHIFCITFALNRYDGWMHQQDSEWGRQKVVEGLALRWKNLLKFRAPEELGIDLDFSYPAVLSLLLTFKHKVESLPTYDEPRMLFKYEV